MQKQVSKCYIPRTKKDVFGMHAVIFVLVAAILSVYNNECTFINIKYRAPSCIMIIILPAYTINSISCISTEFDANEFVR